MTDSAESETKKKNSRYQEVRRWGTEGWAWSLKERRGSVWDDVKVWTWLLVEASQPCKRTYSMETVHFGMGTLALCIFYRQKDERLRKKNHRIKSRWEDEDPLLRINKVCHFAKEPNSWQMPGLLRWQLHSPESRESSEGECRSRKDFRVMRIRNMS